MQIKKENNQIVITLDNDQNGQPNEVNKLIELLLINDRYSTSMDFTFRNELVKQLKRNLVKGQIYIFDNPSFSEDERLVTIIDGYEDNIKEKINEWYAKIAKEGEQVYFAKHSNRIEIRTKARKNQSYLNTDYKVVKIYYYQCI